jgi:hypothetical protein
LSRRSPILLAIHAADRQQRDLVLPIAHGRLGHDVCGPHERRRHHGHVATAGRVARRVLLTHDGGGYAACEQAVQGIEPVDEREHRAPAPARDPRPEIHPGVLANPQDDPLPAQQGEQNQQDLEGVRPERPDDVHPVEAAPKGAGRGERGSHDGWDIQEVAVGRQPHQAGPLRQ